MSNTNDREISNPYAALVALRTGLKFEAIQPHIVMREPLAWVTAIGGAMAVIEDKSCQLYREIEKLDAWIELSMFAMDGNSLSSVGGPLCTS